MLVRTFCLILFLIIFQPVLALNNAPAQQEVEKEQVEEAVDPAYEYYVDRFFYTPKSLLERTFELGTLRRNVINKDNTNSYDMPTLRFSVIGVGGRESFGAGRFGFLTLDHQHGESTGGALLTGDIVFEAGLLEPVASHFKWGFKVIQFNPNLPIYEEDGTPYIKIKRHIDIETDVPLPVWKVGPFIIGPEFTLRKGGAITTGYARVQSDFPQFNLDGIGVNVYGLSKAMNLLLVLGDSKDGAWHLGGRVFETRDKARNFDSDPYLFEEKGLYFFIASPEYSDGYEGSYQFVFSYRMSDVEIQAFLDSGINNDPDTDVYEDVVPLPQKDIKTMFFEGTVIIRF